MTAASKGGTLLAYFDGKNDQAGPDASGYSGFVPRKDSANPVVEALWFIESHSAGAITLDDVSQNSGRVIPSCNICAGGG